MSKPNKAVTKSIDDLLKQIDEAFSGVPCPPLAEVTTIWHTWEFAVFYENGIPDDWHDLSANVLACNPDILSLVGPQGFLFFFPASMRHGYFNTVCLWRTAGRLLGASRFDNSACTADSPPLSCRPCF